MEPTQSIEINSILSANFPKQPFANDATRIPTVLPQRTFLEKIFLLHEEFSQNSEKIRVNRLSRHLYDLEKLMDTKHGIEAMKNRNLYYSILSHREKFNALRGLDYSSHIPRKIRILPPKSVIKDYQKDYDTMTNFMIYGEYLTFGKLIDRISELQERVNKIALV